MRTSFFFCKRLLNMRTRTKVWRVSRIPAKKYSCEEICWKKYEKFTNVTTVNNTPLNAAVYRSWLIFWCSTDYFDTFDILVLRSLWCFGTLTFFYACEWWTALLSPPVGGSSGFEPPWKQENTNEGCLLSGASRRGTCESAFCWWWRSWRKTESTKVYQLWECWTLVWYYSIRYE